MGVLDDATRFYGTDGGEWSLGDVVVVPTAVLWNVEERPGIEAPQAAPAPDGTTSVRLDLWSDGLPQLPQPSVEAWLTPAVIVVDDCVLDKEFNIVVETLLKQGRTLDTAKAEALALSPDPLIPVCPLLPYNVLRYHQPESIRTGQLIGYFSFPAAAGLMDAGYVDFVRTVPVSRRLLTQPLAVMSDDARAILRWKLAEFYAVRNFATDSELENAKGKRITDVRILEDSKKRLVVGLHLEGTPSPLVLRQEPRRPEAPAGQARGRRV